MQVREVRKVWGVYDASGRLVCLKEHDPEQDPEDLKAWRVEHGEKVVCFVEQPEP